MSYNKLPLEIKFEIWKLVLPKRPTMHHFKIDIPSPDSLDTTMVKSPANVTKKANPLWDYWKYCIMDVASKDVAKFQKRLILWPPAPVKEEDKSEGDETKGNQAKEDDKNGVDMKKNNDKDKNNEGKRKRSVPKASIDADLDVVHFKFTSTLFDPFHLAGDKTRKTFAGIKHVAVDWKMTYSKWDLPAFVCCCRNRRHILGPVCPIAMAHWLSHFEDLQVFYIVLKIARSDVDEMGMYRAAEKRYQDELSARKEDPILQETIQDWSDSQVTLLREQKAQMKRPAAAVIREWMDHFRQIAKYDGLDIIYDRGTTYYEVEEESAHPLTKKSTIWRSLRRVETIWYHGLFFTGSEKFQKNSANTKFKLLVHSPSED